MPAASPPANANDDKHDNTISKNNASENIVTENIVTENSVSQNMNAESIVAQNIDVENVAAAQGDAVLLDIESLSLCAGQECVLKVMSLQVYAGEIICLLGPSGCGKTTTLRAIAGFVQPAQGSISIANQTVASPNIMTPPEKRQVGMIFQDHALFPHLTVKENIGFGLTKLSRETQKKRIDHYMHLVQIEALGDKYPHELSGGQQQRVAVARALAPHPRLLLMDEPFSNLDVNLRKQMQRQLQEVLRKEGITAIMVTHDQEESFAMADRVALLSDGKLQQIGSPYKLYHEPANRIVASFIGLGSFINATVQDAHHLETEAGIIASSESLSWSKGHEVELLLRPDDILPNPDSTLKARVAHKVFKGAATLYRITLSRGTPLEVIFPSHFDYNIGDEIGIEVEADHVVTFEKSSPVHNRTFYPKEP
jgi:iron(III) transport system ATP-binding protein